MKKVARAFLPVTPGRRSKTGRAVVALSAGLLMQPSVWAQGCSMCKTSLAGQMDSLIASLSLGIVILLVPPLAILSTILYVAHRRGG